MADTPVHRVTLRLSDALYAQLEARGSHGQPLAAIVRRALVEYLARQPDTPEAAVELATAVAVMAARLDGLQEQVEALVTRVETLAAREQPGAATTARLDILDAQIQALTIQLAAVTATTAERLPQQPRPTGRPGITPAQLQAIAQARQQHPTLSLHQLAQHLFDQGIYRASGKGGEPRPVDHSRLGRWLAQARVAGVL
jgi:hypothetical protein